jgi:hypothetical protein
MASANPASLSSSETGVNIDEEAKKKRLSDSAHCQETINGLFTLS